MDHSAYEAAYEALLAHVADPAFLADAQGAILYANPAFQAYRGQPGYIARQCARVATSRQIVRDATGPFETTFAPVVSSTGELQAIAGVFRPAHPEPDQRFGDTFANAPSA